MVYVEFEREDGQYEVVLNAPYTENYNETLDSASIVIKHIDKDLDIRPYDFCKIIFNDLSREEMLVNEITKQMHRKNKNPYYTYTITLMSETKILEKIQLPNRSYTDGQSKYIYKQVQNLFDLYIPNILTINGIVPLLTISNRFRTKFNYKRFKDISFSKPTLKQVITGFISQYGCIPVIKNRELDYIDFNESQGTFDETTANTSIRSNASDSYLTSLAINDNNILDTNNEVYEMMIPFRDKSTGLLYQESNLKLNTTYPIYKINKVILNNDGCSVSIVLKNEGDYLYPINNNLTPVVISQGTNGVNFRITCSADSGSTIWKFNYKIVKLESSYNEQFEYGSKKLNSFSLNTLETEYGHIEIAETIEGSGSSEKYYLDIQGNSIQYDAKYHYILYLQLLNPQSYQADNACIITFTTLGAENEDKQIGSTYTILLNQKIKTDITSLVVESSKRKLLSYDYTQTPYSVSDLSKQYYGTVEYNINSTEISGFSTSFTEVWGISSSETRYIWYYILNTIYGGKPSNTASNWKITYSDSDRENVYNEIFNPPDWDNLYLGLPSAVGQNDKYVIIGVNNQALSKVVYETSGENYLSSVLPNLTFDIYYQPLYEMNIRVDKDTEFNGFKIEQLNSKNSGISNFDDLISVNQDTINRLGNDVYTFTKRETNIDDAYPLGSINDKGEVIFKKQTEYKNGYFDITYYACKDYIITNYSTSITTKYRAYAYTDYNNTIYRNENQVIYINYGSYNKNSTADKPLTFNNDNYNLVDMLFCLKDAKDINGALITYRCDNYADENRAINTKPYKLCLGVSYEDNIGIVYFLKNFDSVGVGIWVEDDTKVGGLAQHWYMKVEYNPRQITFNNLLNNTNFVINPRKLPQFEVENTNTFFTLNPSQWYHQDQSEILGLNLQIKMGNQPEYAYYISNRLLKNSLFVPSSVRHKMYIISNDGTWNDDDYTYTGEKEEIASSHLITITSSENKIVTKDAIKIIEEIDADNNIYHDIARLGLGTIYFTNSSLPDLEHYWDLSGNVPKYKNSI